MALIFSLAMLCVPYADVMAVTCGPTCLPPGSTLPRPGRFRRTLWRIGAHCPRRSIPRCRASGRQYCRLHGRSIFGLFSPKLGAAAGEKIRTFHAGLDTMRTFGEFGTTAALSIGMWVVIAAAYFEGIQAFSASPQLAAVTPSKCVLLMAASGGASIFQLPILGWFTQIAVVAAAMHRPSGRQR